MKPAAATARLAKGKKGKKRGDDREREREECPNCPFQLRNVGLSI